MYISLWQTLVKMSSLVPLSVSFCSYAFASLWFLLWPLTHVTQEKKKIPMHMLSLGDKSYYQWDLEIIYPENCSQPCNFKIHEYRVTGLQRMAQGGEKRLIGLLPSICPSSLLYGLALSIFGLSSCGRINSNAPQGSLAEAPCGGFHWLCVFQCGCVGEREIEVTLAASADDGETGKEVESAKCGRGPVDGLKCSMAKSNAAEI